MQNVVNEIIGQKGITAKVLLDSISNETGQRITTFELTYPRMILAELNTHRVFSRNSASSRAIPFAKMQAQLTASPVRFGAANAGMQDKGEDYDADILIPQKDNIFRVKADTAWYMAKMSAMEFSNAFYNAGYHKQVYNRLTEPFQMMKTVLTTTEFSNFEWLRNDTAADPSLEELAKCMVEARNKSTPMLLEAGDWHLPYLEWTTSIDDNSMYYKNEVDEWTFITLEDAIKVSAARCAAVSFRNTDYGLEKCKEVYERLVGDDRKHASALEHQATPILPYYEGIWNHRLEEYKEGKHPINQTDDSKTWQAGVSHVDREGNLWSGNFKGWIQHRKLIVGENYA